MLTLDYDFGLFHIDGRQKANRALNSYAAEKLRQILNNIGTGATHPQEARLEFLMGMDKVFPQYSEWGATDPEAVRTARAIAIKYLPSTGNGDY